MHHRHCCITLLPRTKNNRVIIQMIGLALPLCAWKKRRPLPTLHWKAPLETWKRRVQMMMTGRRETCNCPPTRSGMKAPVGVVVNLMKIPVAVTMQTHRGVWK